jgi:hypothetical protein
MTLNVIYTGVMIRDLLRRIYILMVCRRGRIIDSSTSVTHGVGRIVAIRYL